MPRARVAEHHLRAGSPSGHRRLRVDLHGVSVFGPGDDRTMIRWESITSIEAGPAGVTVTTPSAELTYPPGAFGRESAALADQLRAALSITERPDVIGDLATA